MSYHTYAVFSSIDTTIKFSCIYSPKFCENQIVYRNETDQQDNLPYPADKDACAANECVNGQCRPRRKGGYRCRCKKGWSGKLCNQGWLSLRSNVSHEILTAYIMIWSFKELRLTAIWSSTHVIVIIVIVIKVVWFKSNKCNFVIFLFVSAAPSCSKEAEKAYVYDYGCRSRRPIRQFTCKGSCGTDCCEPRRYRQKRVAMICNDGTKYMKEVDIVRKCRCSRGCRGI